MGFDAIWISPAIENTPGGYHGYWAKNFSKINSEFGGGDKLKALVNKAHSKGIWIMLDVVANHIGPVGTDYSTIYPFNKPEHYHSICQVDSYCNTAGQYNSEHCRLADLPDLDQDGNIWVKEQLINWIKLIVQEFNIDGLRIDTIPYIYADFWSDFSRSAGVYTVGEVFCPANLDYMGSYLNHIDGLLNYGIFNQVRSSFKGGSFRELSDAIKAEQGNSLFNSHADYLGNFLDNHDNDRFLHNYNNINNLNGALIFTLFYKGIPIVYYGDEQQFGGGHDPNNREPLWTHMKTSAPVYQVLKRAIRARKNYEIAGKDYQERWVSDHLFAFLRGNVLCIFTAGTIYQVQTIPNLPYSDGSTLCNILLDSPPDDCVTVNGGKAHFEMSPDLTKVYAPYSPYKIHM